MMRVANLWYAVTVLAATACSGTGRVPVDDDPPLEDVWTAGTEIVVAVTAENFCTEMVHVACANFHECCTVALDHQGTMPLYLASESDCRHYAELDCLESYAPALAGLVSGEVLFDADVAGKCLAELLHKDQPCSRHVPFDVPLPACAQSPFSGTRAEGESCSVGVECGSGICDFELGCVRLPREGEECGDWPDECEEELYCRWNDGDTTDTCARKKKPGEECKSDEACASDDCNPGTCLFEDGSKGPEPCFTTKECKGKCATAGEACWTNWDCPKSCTETGGACVTHLDCEGKKNLCLHEDCIPSECVGGLVCAPIPEKPTELVWVDLCSEAQKLLTYEPGPDWAPWW